MKEWLPHRKAFLRIITARDSLADSGKCIHCTQPGGHWRCLDCFGAHALCRSCCRSSHSFLPFHRIQFWTGTHYEQDWLYNLGVVINLGHRGIACPLVQNAIQTLPSQFVPPGNPTSLKHHVDVYACPSGIRDTPTESTLVVIGHVNGVHQVSVRLCKCQEGLQAYQFLHEGLYPASLQRVETAFTFDLLNDSRVENLECKASAYHFFRKLRRLTCPLFPDTIPVALPDCLSMTIAHKTTGPIPGTLPHWTSMAKPEIMEMEWYSVYWERSKGAWSPGTFLSGLSPARIKSSA